MNAIFTTECLKKNAKRPEKELKIFGYVYKALAGVAVAEIGCKCIGTNNPRRKMVGEFPLLIDR